MNELRDSSGGGMQFALSSQAVGPVHARHSNGNRTVSRARIEHMNW
jgi:hypothetical protein